MNRLVKYALAIAIIVGVPKVIMAAFSGDSPRKALEKTVSKLNTGLPRKVDPLTTLTKVELDGRVYRVHYTMDPSAAVDPARKDSYTAMAVKQVCTTDSRRILDEKFSIEYVYSFGPTGSERMAVTVPPGSCS